MTTLAAHLAERSDRDRAEMVLLSERVSRLETAIRLSFHCDTEFERDAVLLAALATAHSGRIEQP